MDSTQSLPNDSLRLTDPASGRSSPLFRLNAWLPLLLAVLAAGYGLAMAVVQDHSHASDRQAVWQLPELTLLNSQLETQYTIRPLNDVLKNQAWRDDDWALTSQAKAGVGYLQTPATFRFTLANDHPEPAHYLLVVPAPFLDHIAPVAIQPDGSALPLPIMGDTYRFRQRLYNLPQWVWPVTLAPQSETVFLFEVINSGPTMLPVSLMKPEALIGSSVVIIAWKAFLYGLLVFALAFNLILVTLLRTPATAWLAVLIGAVVYSQLVIDGFGLWLLWPEWPLLNDLLAVTLPLSVIAFCQFTRHFMELRGPAASVLHLLSGLAGIILITTSLQLPLLGQGTLLVLGVLTSLFTLALALQRIGHNLYARYCAVAIAAIIGGVLLASLRTIGWVPVNELTNSGFYLGAALASMVLTMAVAHRLLDERRQRLSAFNKARQERELRTRLENDYDRLLKTHRITRKPNRAILEETLERLHQRGDTYALCLVRLERYTEIEQALGYKEAESLLRLYLSRFNRYLKHRLADQLVMINGYGVATVDTINHAFAVHIRPDEATAESVWTDITRWLETNFSAGRYSLNWAPSLGLANAPEHGCSASEVLSCAGFATLNPTHTLTVYDPRVADHQYQQQVLMLDLDGALENNHIHLAYQPKVQIRDAEIVSFEALIRWEHPDFGPVAPDRWIPLAEQMGAIHSVTRWVLNRACQDWHTLAADHNDGLAIAINISARDLGQPGFDQTALSILEHHNVAPRNIILEITETAVMVNANQARGMIRTLSQAGFRIALDDFGTGHSSLSALAGFELDELKIDRSFLQDITHDVTRQRIFRTAVELGEVLGLSIVVEGVETEAIAQWLQQFPGLFGQGYYWGFPQPLTRLVDSVNPE